MPNINLQTALSELDEERGTQQDIENLLAYGTDDPKKIAQFQQDEGSFEPVWDRDFGTDSYMDEVDWGESALERFVEEELDHAWDLRNSCDLSPSQTKRPGPSCATKLGRADFS